MDLHYTVTQNNNEAYFQQNVCLRTTSCYFNKYAILVNNLWFTRK